MDSIREQLDRLADMNDEELSTLLDSITTEFGTLQSQDPTRDTVDAMVELADAKDMIESEQARRTAEAEELSQRAAEASARMNGEPASETDIVTDGEDVSDAADVNEDTAPEDAPEMPEGDTEAPASDAEAPESDDAPEDKPEDGFGDAPEEGSPEEEAEESPAEEDEEDKNKPVFSSEEPSVAETISESEAATEEVAADNVVSEGELSAEENQETPAEAAELSANAEEIISEETVTASITPNEEPTSPEAPEELRPVVASAKRPLVITAAADLPGIPMGTEMTGLKAVAQALLDRRKSMSRTSGGDGEQALVASISTNYSASESLFSTDFEANNEKVEAAVDAIVAAGGLTAPVETSYDIYELGETTARPVKDSLVVFGADRGGIRFMTSPQLSDLTGAVSLWTLQDDIDAATAGAPDPVKPCLRVAAGTEVVVYTDAIPLCLTFGNLGARAYPELVERHTELAMVQHARYAETRLLTRIGALSTNVTAASSLGAARDIFVQIEQAAAAYRNRYRLDPEKPLRVIFPEWFKNALRADLTKQLPGDGQDVTFNLADAQINSWFAARKINVTWTLDGETGQIFGAQDAGALNGFPANVIWYLFAEGTFLFLDGGTLDLGLVRDSTLNGTNDYKVFLETFEAVAKVGTESLRVTSALAIRGSATGTTAPA